MRMNHFENCGIHHQRCVAPNECLLQAKLEAVTKQKEAWRAAAEYVEEYIPYQHGKKLFKAARDPDPEPLRNPEEFDPAIRLDHSGYSAALHNDLPSYLASQRPWWCPKWPWVRAVRRAFVQASMMRGEDL